MESDEAVIGSKCMQVLLMAAVSILVALYWQLMAKGKQSFPPQKGSLTFMDAVGANITPPYLSLA